MKSLRRTMLVFCLGSLGGSAAVTAKTVCIGPSEGRSSLIYLHGLEESTSPSAIEKDNRLILEELAKKLSVRVALPQSDKRCANGRRCWPAADASEVLKSYGEIQQKARSCWSGRLPKTYGLLGFSNGGYFAFKLYKVHRDPALTHIFAAGSSGTWDPKSDSINPLSRFFLMLGRKELTLPAAKRFAETFRKSDPRFGLTIFEGGHQLHTQTLLRLIEESGL